LVNCDKPALWKQDIALSVDYFNMWFMEFAPRAFRESREQAIAQVERALAVTGNFTRVTPSILREHPQVLSTLRMCTCPPLARDRLVGLADVPRNMVKCMEDDENPRLPTRMAESELNDALQRITDVIRKMADVGILVWLDRKTDADSGEVTRAAAIIADRLCGLCRTR